MPLPPTETEMGTGNGQSVVPPETSTPSPERDSPASLARTISLACAGIIASVLIVGGISLSLALQIHRINDAVDREYEHILSVDRYESSSQLVITALYSMEA